MRLPLLLLVLVASACVTLPPPRFLDRLPEVHAEEHPGADAVVLYESDHYRLRWKDWLRTELRVHRVVALLTEASFERAVISIPVLPGQKLVALRARVVQPDGTVREVPREDMIEETVAKNAYATVRRRVLRFPGLRVGSIVEWIAEVHGAGGWEKWGLVDPDLPVEHHEVAIEGDPHLVGAMKSYNSPNQVALDHTKAGRWRFTWHADHVPADQVGPWGESWSYRRPWWRFRVTRLRFGPTVNDVMNGWADAVESTVAVQMISDVVGSRRPELDAGECEGAPRCIAARALARLREETPWRDEDTAAARAMTDLVEPSRADSALRALLFMALLDHAGVESHIAAVRRPFSGRFFDPAFPASDAFDRLLVYVPPQKKLDEGFFVSPLCDTCAVGELPADTVGAKGVVIATEAASDHVNVTGRFVEVTGRAVPSLTQRRRFDVDVDGSGTLTIRMKDDVEGRLVGAVRRAVLHQTHAEADAGALALVKHLSPNARLKSREPWTFEKARGTRELTFEIPGLAVRTAGGLLVPLTLLGGGWSHELLTDTRPHRTAVVNERVYEDVLRLHVPAGWHLALSPEPLDLRAPSVHVQVSVSEKDGTVEVRRVAEITPGRHPAKDYAALREAASRWEAVAKNALALEPDEAESSRPPSR